MSSQQFPRHGLPPSTGGAPQIPAAGNLMSVSQPSNASAGTDADSSRDAEHGQQDHPPAGGGGTLAFREDKQETMVVRPYPQVQTHSQPQAVPQAVPIQAGTPLTVPAPPVHLQQGQPAVLTEGQMKAVLKSPMPSRLIAPAPASNQPHIPIPPKVPGHITVTLESSIAPTQSIPVATISGQQGHSSNLHHLMPANIQIIRSGAPALQIGTPAVPPQTFTSHLPRGAAAAAVMSGSKTVLRPATGGSGGPGQPTVQHIIHQTIQSRPAVTSSTAVLPTVVAPISANRTQSPSINPSVTHPADAHGRPGLTIHPPPATVSIQRPQASRDTATRITLPSHPAIGAQKPQPPHTMTQKPMFSSVTPMAAATVAPIVATTVPSTTSIGSVPHTQMTSNTIVTMTMASHSSHATAVTTSAIPVAKVVPQPIAHSSARVQPDYPGERTNLIPIPGHRSSPNPVTMEARSENRPPVPVQFQYFLPTYSSSYPLTHTYTPISSSVSTIRQYPVTPQAPSSALPTQPGVGVATTVHLNHMQLMAVDRIGLPSAQISTQGIQPAPITAQGIQPAPMGVQGLHTPGSITTQGMQQAPMLTQQQQQQPQSEAKPGVVLADGFVASPISSTFGTTQPVATMVQAHAQGGVGGAPTLVSSPRPSILRKKPANEGCVRKNLIPAQPSEASSGRIESGVRGAGSPRPSGVKPKAELHMAVAPPVMATVEALPSQLGEQQMVSSSTQHLAQAIPNMLATSGPGPPSQPSTLLSALPAAMAVTPPIPASMANTVASPTQPAASSTAACAASSTCSDVKIKQEVENMDTQPDPNSNLQALTSQASSLTTPATGDLIPGASPRKKPRKQQHVISTEESEMVETNSTDEEKTPGRPITGRAERCESPPREYVDEEGVRYVPVKPRPPVTLLRQYRNPWKAAYHHFQRYSDIRVKEEKKGTLQDMANQRGVACRAQGWKIHLCAAQLRQLSSLEHDVYSRLSTLQEGLIPKKRAGSDDDLHRINELIQGNMQRCKLVMDQVTEARDTMMKVLDHKEKVLKLLNKNGAVKKSSKLKRKERA
ncbi:histone deacetylase complex subunit SAP130a [Pleuronectes platessa]|uniref:histone deacetylase complex subunit SAP130a n=1 Tax=Pleuronectes platessa TaxID=8262 RepID=UPI00232A782D|nr:histone deacetylase complex subunit SAP130a [Pleuronectes platessa]